VIAIAAGAAHTCAVTSAGGVKCWGYNTYGQLGDGTTTDRPTPVNVSGLTNGVIAIAGGYNHTCALTGAGGVKCWGRNQYGQLGDGTTTDRPTPVSVSGLTSGMIAIAAGSNHTCALTSAGGVKCWGYNYYGQLGDGTTTDRLTPVDVVDGGSITIRVVATTSGHFISSYVQDNASLPVHVQVTNLANNSPVQGASVRISNGDILLGTTGSNGSIDASLQMPSIPSAGDFVTEVIAEVNGQSFSSGPLTLYHADLLAGAPSTLTQDEANNFTNRVLTHYLLEPGPPCPTEPLCTVLNLIDVLANTAWQQTIYSPQAGDVITTRVYKYSAQGVTPVYLYLESTTRAGSTIYSRTKWTEDVTQVQPFLNQRRVTRSAIVVKLASPATLLMVDPTGKRAGYDPATGSFVFDVPVAISYNEDEPYFLIAPGPAFGQYTFQVTGTGTGTYTLDILTLNAQGQASIVFHTTGQTAQGSTEIYPFTYKPPPLFLPIVLK
jgi:hypothetical protein